MIMSIALSTRLDLREQFVITASDLIRTDPRVAVVLAEITAAQFRPVADDHPERVVNVGIREQLLVSAGAGLALAGLRPIVHSFGAFVVERAWEQVKLDFGHQDLGGILVGSYGSYDWPAGGRTHQAPGDVALLDTLRDWTIHVPGHPAELDRQLRGAALGDDRVYLRVGDGQNPEPIGTADGRLTVIREGSRGTVVAVGPTLHKVLPATEGLDVTVLYASTVRPFDQETLRQTLTAPNVIMVEPYLAGTSAAEIARVLSDLPHRQLGLGVGDPDTHRYGEPDDHDRLHGLDPAGLRSSITRFLGS
jgi:transketolase